MEVEDSLSSPPPGSVAVEIAGASGQMAEEMDVSEPSSRSKRSQEDEPKDPRPVKRSNRREQRFSIIASDPRLWTAQEAEDFEEGMKAKPISLMVGDPNNGGKNGNYPRSSDARPTRCFENRLRVEQRKWIAENALQEDAKGNSFLTKLMQAGSQCAVATVISILLTQTRLEDNGGKAKELILFCLRENRAFALAGLIQGGLRTLDEQVLMWALHPRPTVALRSLLDQLAQASVALPPDVVGQRGEPLFELILDRNLSGNRDAQWWKASLPEDRRILNWLWDQLNRCGIRLNRESRQKALVCLAADSSPNVRRNQIIDTLASERPGEPIIEWEKWCSHLLRLKISCDSHVDWALEHLRQAASAGKAVLSPISWAVFNQLRSVGEKQIFDLQGLELQDEDEWRRELLKALECHLRGEDSQLFKTALDQANGHQVASFYHIQRRDQELKLLVELMCRAFRGRAIARVDLEALTSCPGGIVLDRIRQIRSSADRIPQLVGILHNLVVECFELTSGSEPDRWEIFLKSWCCPWRCLPADHTLIARLDAVGQTPWLFKGGLSGWLSGVVDPDDPVIESLLELQLAGRVKNQNGQLLASVHLDYQPETIQQVFQAFSSYPPRVLNRLIDWMCANEAMPSPERGDLAPWMVVGTREQRIKWMAQWQHHCWSRPGFRPSAWVDMRGALDYCMRNEIPWDGMADLLRSQWTGPRDEWEWTVRALEWLGTESASAQGSPSIHEDELLARVLKIGEDEPQNQIVLDEWLELLEKAVDLKLLRTASQLAQRMARSRETQEGSDVQVLARLIPLSHIDAVLDLSMRMIRSDEMKRCITAEPRLVIDLCLALAGNAWELFPLSEEDSRWPLYRHFGSLLGDLCKTELPDAERLWIESSITNLVYSRAGLAGQWIGEFDLPPGRGALVYLDGSVQRGICFVPGLWSQSQQGFESLRAKIGASAIPSREILIACLLEPEELADQTWEILQQHSPRLFAAEGEADIPPWGWWLVTLGNDRPNRSWEQVRHRWQRIQEICPEFLSQRGDAASRQVEWKALFDNAAAAGPSFYEGVIQFALEDARSMSFFRSEGAPILLKLMDLMIFKWPDVGAWMSEQTRDLVLQEVENAVRAGFISINQPALLVWWMAMGSREEAKEALARYPIGDFSSSEKRDLAHSAWALGFDDSKELLALEPSYPEWLNGTVSRRYLVQHPRHWAIRGLREGVPVGQNPWDVLERRLSFFSKQTIRESLSEGLQGGPLEECLQDAARLEALIDGGSKKFRAFFDSSCLYEAPPCMQVLELDGEQQRAALRYLREKVHDFDLKGEHQLTGKWKDLLQFAGLSTECEEIRSDLFRLEEVEATRALLVQFGALLEGAGWDEDAVLSTIRSLLQDVVCLSGTQANLQNLILRIASKGRSGLKEALISRIKELVLAVFDGESLLPNQTASALNPQRITHQKNHLLWLLNPSLQLVPQRVMPDRLSNYVWHPHQGGPIEIPRDLAGIVRLMGIFKSHLESEFLSMGKRLSEVIFARNPETNGLLFEEEINQLLEAHWQTSEEVPENFHRVLSGLEKQRLATLHTLFSSWQTLTPKCRGGIQKKLREAGYVEPELPGFLNWLHQQVQSGPRSRQEILDLLDFQDPLNLMETQLLRRLLPDPLDAQSCLGHLEMLECYRVMLGGWRLPEEAVARIIHKKIQEIPGEGQLSELQRTELWNALCYECKRRADKGVLRAIQEQPADDPLPAGHQLLTARIGCALGIFVTTSK
jgi:hypothetical protein